jgi:hypothetical protein
MKTTLHCIRRHEHVVGGNSRWFTHLRMYAVDRIPLHAVSHPPAMLWTDDDHKFGVFDDALDDVEQFSWIALTR